MISLDYRPFMRAHVVVHVHYVGGKDTAFYFYNFKDALHFVHCNLDLTNVVDFCIYSLVESCRISEDE